jgi:serine/threonine protein kinase
LNLLNQQLQLQRIVSLDLRMAFDRLRLVQYSVNLFRIFKTFSNAVKLNPNVANLKLFTAVNRADGGTLTLMEDMVIKDCKPQDPRIYEILPRISNVVRVQVTGRVVQPPNTVRLHITPIGTNRLPSNIDELKSAIRSVLRAAMDLHSERYLHRDIRWPNILRTIHGQWLLTDFELAAQINQPLPSECLEVETFSPEVRQRNVPCTPALDMWQIGQLVVDWLLKHPRVAADDQVNLKGFVLLLTANNPLARPSADVALHHDWLRIE